MTGLLTKLLLDAESISDGLKLGWVSPAEQEGCLLLTLTCVSPSTQKFHPIAEVSRAGQQTAG